MHGYAPNLEEVEGAYWFGPVCLSVRLSITTFLLLFVLKLVNHWSSDLLLLASDPPPHTHTYTKFGTFIKIYLPPPLPPKTTTIFFFQIWILCQNFVTRELKIRVAGFALKKFLTYFEMPVVPHALFLHFTSFDSLAYCFGFSTPPHPYPPPPPPPKKKKKKKEKKT